MGTKQQVHERFKIDRPKFDTFRKDQLHRAVEKFDTIELKYDGIWGVAFIQPSKNKIDVYSRTGRLKSTLRPESMGLQKDTILLGEFMHGSNWAIRKGVAGKFFVYDCLSYKSADVTQFPLSDRREVAEEAVAKIEMNDKKSGSVFELGAYFDRSHNVKEIWEKYVEGEHYEGLVFKNSDSHFGETWGRCKKKFEVEYVCMGFTKSDSPKYKKRGVKSVIGGLFKNGLLVKTIQVSGLTDEQRRTFFLHPHKFRMRVFTASGRGLFKNGAVRHPSFEGWREDKPASECTIEDVQRLGGYE